MFFFVFNSRKNIRFCCWQFHFVPTIILLLLLKLLYLYDGIPNISDMSYTPHIYLYNSVYFLFTQMLLRPRQQKSSETKPPILSLHT